VVAVGQQGSEKGCEAMSRKQKMAGTAPTVALLVVVLAIGQAATSGTGPKPRIRVATTSFSDGNPGADATAVADVVTKGMLQGCGSTYFCPGESVPCADMAVALAQAMRGSACTPAPPPADDVGAGRLAGILCARLLVRA